jgi:hypothetical protein
MDASDSDRPEPPPADTHDSSEPPADVPDHPEPRKKSSGAVKKRKRSLSYKRQKGSNNQKSSRADQPIVDVDSSVPAEAAPQEDIAVDSTAFKKTTKADILRLLFQCQSELSQARSDNLSKDKTIHRLTKKNEQLIETRQQARGAAREAKTFVKSVEKSSLASAKKLEGEVFVAEQFAQQQSALLKEKEKEWNTIAMDSVAKAREEEKVRLQYLFLLSYNATISQSIYNSLSSSQQRRERAVAVEKKNAAKQTKKLEQDYNAILNKKNSHIKVSLHLHCHHSY